MQAGEPYDLHGWGVRSLSFNQSLRTNEGETLDEADINHNHFPYFTSADNNLCPGSNANAQAGAGAEKTGLFCG
jgi:hypothetical protein